MKTGAAAQFWFHLNLVQKVTRPGHAWFIPHVPAAFLATELPVTTTRKGERMLLLLILLAILVLGAAPAWPYSRGWGYYPSGGLGTILLIVIVLMLLGYVHI